MRLARCRIDPQTRRQQHQVSIRAEHRTRGTRARHLTANRRVEPLHAVRVREIIARRTVDAGQRIEVCSQPAVVLRNQLVEELRALVRRYARHVRPALVAARRPRNHSLSALDLEHAAEEIEYVRISFQTACRNRLAQFLGCRRIELRQSQVHAAHCRIGEEDVDELALLFFDRAQPVIGSIQHRNRRRLVVVYKRTVGAQRLFEVRQREPGIDRQKRFRSVDGFEHDFRAASTAHAVSDNLQQLASLRRFALVDLDHLLCAAQLFEFAGLRQITEHQLQVFRRVEGFVVARGLVSVGDDVARHRRQQVLGVHVRRERRHAREGAQRTMDIDDVLGICRLGVCRCGGCRGGGTCRQSLPGPYPAVGDGLFAFRSVGLSLGFQQLFPGLSRLWTSLPLECFRICAEIHNVIRRCLYDSLQEFARPRAVSLQLHLPRLSDNILSKQRSSSSEEHETERMKR